MLPNTDTDESLHSVALTLIEGIGARTGRLLIEHFGSATEAMRAPLKQIRSVPGVGEVRAKLFKESQALRRAEQEIEFALKHGINLLLLTGDNYPARLKACADAPIVLYFKGSAAPETKKMLAVVGTRKQTDYGTQLCEQLVDSLAGQEGLTIVSGLAHGIDGVVHRRCVAAGIPTIGVVAHGLDRIYPPAHRSLAKDMLSCGGLLTEFPSGTTPERTNFPVRNRLVAGLCDITVVAESDEKGGAMITAYMAASYNREVAAFPGRISDSKSDGPNKLIRMNIASLIRNADDLLELMNWKTTGPSAVKQKELFLHLEPAQQKLVDALNQSDGMHADDIMHATGMNTSTLAATLLGLEMQGVVRSLPGKRYRLS